jgi:hypothetical protein
MKVSHYYHLGADTIRQVMTDESIPRVDRVLKLAIMSLWGSDAPKKIAERAMLVNQAMGEVYAKGT